MFEDSFLVFVDGLPLLGDCSGEIRETDLPVALAVAPGLSGLSRSRDDGLDGGNFDLVDGPHSGESIDDPGRVELEENIVGSQGTLGLVPVLVLPVLAIFRRRRSRRCLALLHFRGTLVLCGSLRRGR